MPFSAQPFRLWAEPRRPKGCDAVVLHVLEELANTRALEDIGQTTGLPPVALDAILATLASMGLATGLTPTPRGHRIAGAIRMAREFNEDPVRGLFASAALAREQYQPLVPRQPGLPARDYSFTSPAVVKGLLDAKRRGVDVRVILDDKGNRGRANLLAMKLLIGADIAVRTTDRFAIHHVKYIVIDGRHTQTGSFNYSQAAARSNSENVLVVWNDEVVASRYLRHWETRWSPGVAVEIP